MTNTQRFLSSAYGLRWNATTDRLAFIQSTAMGKYLIFNCPTGSNNHQAVTQASAPRASCVSLHCESDVVEIDGIVGDTAVVEE